MLPVGQAFSYLGFSHYTRIPKEITFFSFSFPRSSQSQFVFAFKWGSPKGVLWELTWTALPQGFRDRPPLVSKALAHDLQDVRLAGDPRYSQQTIFSVLLPRRLCDPRLL